MSGDNFTYGISSELDHVNIKFKLYYLTFIR